MSKDSSIYFPHKEFPYEKWRSVLDIFTGTYQSADGEFKITLERRKASADHTDEWVMYESIKGEVDSSVLWISLSRFTDNFAWSHNHQRPEWEIGLHWSSSVRFDISLTTLIPFAALSLFDDATFYERQMDTFCTNLAHFRYEFRVHEAALKNHDELNIVLEDIGMKKLSLS